MKNERVGDDGHSHARGLLAVLLVERLRHILQRMEAGRFTQLASRLANTLLQNLRSLGEQPLGQRDVFNTASEIVNTTGEPARGRPTHSHIRLLQRIRAVVELGSLDMLLQVRLRCLAQFPWDLDGDSLLDPIAVVLQELP